MGVILYGLETSSFEFLNGFDATVCPGSLWFVFKLKVERCDISLLLAV